MIELPSHVDIREVGPRDGLQIESPISTDEKIRLIKALVATGVQRIEATAFVSPRAVPAMADAEQIAEFVLSIPGVDWSGLVASPNGAKRAIASGLRTIEYVVSAADGHSQANARRSTQEALDAVDEVGRIVHDVGRPARGDHRDRLGLSVRRTHRPASGPRPSQRGPWSSAPTSCASATPSAPPPRCGCGGCSRRFGRPSAAHPVRTRCRWVRISTTPAVPGSPAHSPPCRRA